MPAPTWGVKIERTVLSGPGAGKKEDFVDRPLMAKLRKAVETELSLRGYDVAPDEDVDTPGRSPAEGTLVLSLTEETWDRDTKDADLFRQRSSMEHRLEELDRKAYYRVRFTAIFVGRDGKTSIKEIEATAKDAPKDSTLPEQAVRLGAQKLMKDFTKWMPPVGG